MTSKMEAAMLPCPFCGGEARMIYGDRGEVWQVRCNSWTGDIGSKACMGGGAYAYSEAEAIAAWNRRAARNPEGEPTPVATYYTEGQDADWFEALSDKDFAWRAKCAAMDIADGDFDCIEKYIPVVGILSLAGERIERLLASSPSVTPSGTGEEATAEPPEANELEIVANGLAAEGKTAWAAQIKVIASKVRSFAPPDTGIREAAIEECAKIAERDVDWTMFARQPKKDWKTGEETNVFAPMDDPENTFPSPVNVFAYANGIAAGRAIAAAIRALQPHTEQVVSK